MSKFSAKQAKQEKPKQVPTRLHKDNRMQRRLWGSVVVFCTLVGGVAAVLTLLPRPSMSVVDPVDPDNPFSSAFTVSNNNFVPLEDVSVGIVSERIQWEGGGTIALGKPPYEDSAVAMDTRWQHHYLGVDDKFTITPSQIFSTQEGFSGPNGVAFRSAVIAVIVKYYPWFIPLPRSRAFRYEAHRQTNGKFYWYSLPLR
jgi:hypothetical protein